MCESVCVSVRVRGHVWQGVRRSHVVLGDFQKFKRLRLRIATQYADFGVGGASNPSATTNLPADNRPASLVVGLLAA